MVEMITDVRQREMKNGKKMKNEKEQREGRN